MPRDESLPARAAGSNLSACEWFIIRATVPKGCILTLVLAARSVAAAAQMPLPSPSAGLDLAAALSPERRAAFEAAMKAQDYKRAETLLVEAINANPNSPQLLILAAGVFFLDGDYVNTVIAYKKAERLAPLDDRSRFTLAMAFIALDRREWARQELEKLASADPKSALYPYWLARLDYDEQKFAAAIEKLNRAISLKPDFVKAYDNLGLNLEALGKFEEAQRAYEEAIRLNRAQKPGSPWPPLNLGVMLLKLGKLDLAEPRLREALSFDPKSAEAHYRLGALLEKKGKTAEAIAELTQAGDLDTKYPDPLYALARLYRQAGEMDKAQAALAAFQKRKSDKRPARTTKASMPSRARTE